MNKYVFLILAVLFAFSISISAQTSWVGGYEFDEDGGKTAGGSVIYISHQLQIIKGDDGLIATLKSNGYQTSKDLNCIAKSEASRLLIFFESYGENNIFETFKQGDLLLTLEKRTAKGKEELLTFWGKFTPEVEKNEKTGKVYFSKSDSIDTN